MQLHLGFKCNNTIGRIIHKTIKIITDFKKSSVVTNHHINIDMTSHKYYAEWMQVRRNRYCTAGSVAYSYFESA